MGWSRGPLSLNSTRHFKRFSSVYVRLLSANNVFLAIALIRQWRIMQGMVIIETSIFTKCIKQLMSDEQYRELQEALVTRPGLGDLIRGSGGLRKVRWKLDGTGKSGGVRVIYYWVVNDDQIRMLYVYPKGKQENLTADQLAALKAIVERW